MEAATMPANPMYQFLDMLLNNKPDDAYVLIWHLPEKQSHWIQEKGRVVEKILELQQDGRQIYIGCGWALEEGETFKRALSENICGIPALWFDADIAHSSSDVHKKPDLPPNIPAVINALKNITPEPSIIVNSGYGLHLWWLFEQPWIFENDDERKVAARLSQAWHKYIHSQFKKLGWEADTTSSLAQILRVPGTYNYKVADDPKLVEMMHSTASRYTPDAIREWIKDHDKGVIASIVPRERLAGEGNFHLNPNAEPPGSKFAELLALDVRVGEIWRKKKRDGDKSQSGHDCSLAVWCVQAGFDDQEIANTLVAFRRIHVPDDLKIDNKQYYERTIEFARSAQGKDFEYLEDEKDVLEKVVATDTEYARNPFTEDERVKALRILNRWVDVGDFDITLLGKAGKEKENGKESDTTPIQPALVNIICYTSDPAVYYIDLYNQEGKLRHVKIGDGNDIRDQRKWSRAIWDHRGHDTRKIEKDMWQKAIKLIARAMVRELPGEDSTEGGMIKGFVRDYITSKVALVKNPEERYEQLKRMTPYIENDKLYISLPLLAQYIRTHRGRNLEERELSVLLRGIGGQQRDINFRMKSDTRRQQRRLWCIPWSDTEESHSDDDTMLSDEEIEAQLPQKERNITEYQFEDV